MTSINKLLNDYLEGRRIPKEQFDDLKIVTEAVGENKNIRLVFLSSVNRNNRMATKIGNSKISQNFSQFK